jgi:xanthine dehydrogenase/oxidase
MEYKHLVYTGDIKEYTQLNVNGETLELGANITLNKLIKELKKAIKLVKSHQASTLNALLTNLKWFAGNQIRNFATLAGNIITGSPISDLNPILIATGANLIVESIDGRRSIPMRELYTGYRKNALKENEVAISLEVPLAKEGEFVRAYKQAKRKDDDIAIANGCFKVQLKSTDNGYQVVDLHGGLGGVAPTTLHLNTLTDIAKDKVWGDETLLAAITDEILDKVKFDYTVPGGQPTYRRTLIVSFFKKFWLQTCKELNVPCNISLEGLEDIERNVSFGVQRFDDSNFNKTLGSAQMHVSGLKQTTGVAKYVDDIPKQFNELFGALVISDKAHANIKSIDYSEALKIPGVYKIDHKDVPGHNKFGAVIQDEEIFASEKVNTAGQIIAVVLADDKLTARKAANLVKIEYEVLPHVLTIQEAIDQDSLYSQYRHIGRGNLEEEFAKSDHIFEGEYYIAGQEHFYLETQGTLAIPKGEGHEIELISSNQGLNELQMVVAEALDIPFNRVVCKAKRLGGGFGGKESRGTPYGAVAAVAAHTLNRPVRVVLDRDTDMCSSGQRHPFLGKWKIGVTKEGKFKALDVTLYNNAGHSLDLSLGVMDRAVTHVDNCYFFPALNVVGKLAKTNTPSNTAYRGFGGPQGMIICEMMVSEVADRLGLDQLEIRKMNMYEEGQSTHFNNELLDWHVPEMWERILNQSNYTERRALVDKFNSENVWKKRGLAVTPTKFGISFGVKFLNQAGALVHIYTDGSVLLSHGGVEMGQGLHTKMTQICADTLGIPVEQVFISETSTDKVINAAPTAASASSDLNGYAIYNACVELRDRIQPYRDANPNATLKEWAKAAYFDRVNLSANGFYKTPDIGYDFDTNQGLLFFYYTSGVSVSEVEIDVLTGDHTILRADIIMDIGQSINVATDIGQIEGAFIQGVGLTTIEEPLFHPDGRTFTKGPGNYKIPGFRDIPQEFYVDILEGKEYKNLKTIKRSKGVGEPPLFMGASVFFAIRDAIKQARLANGITEVLKLTSPATSEKIRLNCQDDLVNLSKVVPKNPTDKLWAHNI